MTVAQDSSKLGDSSHLESSSEPDDSAPPAVQEVRLAVTMVGGVSLAIWMGGVAREISHVVQASRGPATEPPQSGDSDQAPVIRACYRELLDLLRVSVSVDVLTGTSAGGINAACLGVAEGYGSTLGSLRDVWLETGSLSKLLRDPDENQPRSVLQGDAVMLKELNDALTRIAREGRPGANPDISVLLTSTMVDGETTQFTDALGSRVRDIEHRLLFRFDRDYWERDGSQAPLALAARSTASFPAAFELSRMSVADQAQQDPLHPDMSPYANALPPHWLTDGGVLLNKPLAPALRTIFERQASEDVRRLMLYVVPTGEEDVERLPVDGENPPLLGTALSRVVGAITAQTVSTELEDLARHNEAVVRTRGTRVSLARMGTKLSQLAEPESQSSQRAAGLVDEGIMTDYRRRRVQKDAAALVREAMQRLGQIRPDQEAIWAAGTDALLVDRAAEKLMADLPSDPPSGEPSDGELGRFRTTALEDAVGVGLQLMSLGLRLDPSNRQAKRLNEARQKLHEGRGRASRSSRVTEWVADQLPTATGVPGSRPLTTTPLGLPASGESLPDWIGRLAQGWAGAGPGAATVAAEWRALAQALQSVAPTLLELDREPPSRVELPPDLKEAWDDDRRSVRYLSDYLLPASGSDRQVCGRLLALHVTERGLLAESPSVDQRVDLVQVSADTRSLLDPLRNLAGAKLTGNQVHNFGAFYKRSWRANDWMWGRVDGAGWLVHTILDPRRLRLLRDKMADREAATDGTPGMPGRVIFATQVADTFKRLGWVCVGGSAGGSPDDGAAETLLADVEGLRDSIDRELAFLGLNSNLELISADVRSSAHAVPISMPTTALVLARGIQSIIAADELPVVAKAAAADAKAGAAQSDDAKAFLEQSAQFTAQRSPASHPVLSDAMLPAAMLSVQRLFRTCRISDEGFDDERGSDLMTRTIIQTAAVTVNAASAAGEVPPRVGSVLAFLRSATRSAWWVTQLKRPWRVGAFLAMMVVGVIFTASGNSALQAVGPVLVGGGLVYLAVRLLKFWRRTVQVVAVIVVIPFLFAAFIPGMRTWWFGWLGGLTDRWEAGDLAAVWLVVALLILLPSVWAPAAAWVRRDQHPTQ